mgnify:CR=1 FL=1
MTPMKRFEHHHPLFVEGMGGYDTRDPKRVAQDVVESVQSHWRLHPPSKPPLLIVQGDPLEPRGISAITPLVASELGLERGLIVLDEDIASYHAPNADRDNVVMEARYSQLVERLEEDHPGTVLLIETAVDTLLAEKNKSREHLDKPPLADYHLHWVSEHYDKFGFWVEADRITHCVLRRKVIGRALSDGLMDTRIGVLKQLQIIIQFSQQMLLFQFWIVIGKIKRLFRLREKHSGVFA